ncbi:MAG: hypothetical protein H6651_04210 [Ardenticatenales bacterium]|nr:hypothetical protein [Ardenticatenales bacterium]
MANTPNAAYLGRLPATRDFRLALSPTSIAGRPLRDVPAGALCPARAADHRMFTNAGAYTTGCRFQPG